MKATIRANCGDEVKLSTSAGTDKSITLVVTDGFVWLTANQARNLRDAPSRAIDEVEATDG